MLIFLSTTQYVFHVNTYFVNLRNDLKTIKIARAGNFSQKKSSFEWWFTKTNSFSRLGYDNLNINYLFAKQR